MYMRTLLLSGAVALAGCQSPDVVQQSSVHTSTATSFAELKTSKMRLPSSRTMTIDENTQILKNGSINSPVAIFELPADRGKLEIDITSEIQDSVFSPLVMITDKQGNVLESYDASVFEYRKPRLILGDRLVAEIEFYPPSGHQFVDMIIYTTEEELAKSTNTIHPGRAMSEAKGNYMPELKDISKPHAKVGKLIVELDGQGYMVPTSAKPRYPMANKPSNKPQKETTEFYSSAIKKAVEEENIPKALSLLDEAKALGIDGAQKIFVDAVNNKN